MISGFSDSGGVKIHYEIHRTSSLPALILLHGNGESSRIFDDVIPRLIMGFNVITIDTRGHGESDAGAGDFPVFARDVISVMDTLGIKKAAVLGFSDGGNIALQLACDFPGRVSGIIAVSANARPDGLVWWFRIQVRFLYRLFSFMNRLGFDTARRAELNRLMAVCPKISDDMLRNITAPALILTGDRDMITVKHTRSIAALIPRARLVIFTGAGHFSMFSDKFAYINEINSFLNNI